MGLFKSKDNNKDNNNAMECKKYYNVKTKKFSFKGFDLGFLSGVVQGVKLASFEKENIELGDKLLLFDQMQYAICQSISAITDEKLKDRLLMYHIFLIGEMNKMATVEGYQGEVLEPTEFFKLIDGQDSSVKIKELKELIDKAEPDPNKRVKEEEIIKIINYNLKNSVNVNGNNNTIFDGVNDSNIAFIDFIIRNIADGNERITRKEIMKNLIRNEDKVYEVLEELHNNEFKNNGNFLQIYNEFIYPNNNFNRVTYKQRLMGFIDINLQ